MASIQNFIFNSFSTFLFLFIHLLFLFIHYLLEIVLTVQKFYPFDNIRVRSLMNLIM